MQLHSAALLLKKFPNDVDVFDIKAEEGVEQLAWGMTKILAGLKGKVVEIGIYAMFKYPALNQTSHINVRTDSTNSKTLSYIT